MSSDRVAYSYPNLSPRKTKASDFDHDTKASDETDSVSSKDSICSTEDRRSSDPLPSEDRRRKSHCKSRLFQPELFRRVSGVSASLENITFLDDWRKPRLSNSDSGTLSPGRSIDMEFSVVKFAFVEFGVVQKFVE